MTSPHLCEAMVHSSDPIIMARVEWCRRTLTRAFKKIFDRYEPLDEVLGV